ncbi:MAG: hypothetical protein IH991_12480 [Planctomycetes bacterium]|nr:hypothetical protein [Planctomycetota bacterium]
MIFEMLVLDPAKKTHYDGTLSLLFALRSYSRLWQNPKLIEDELTIKDGETSLCITDQLGKTDESAPTQNPKRAFSICLSGDFDAIEPLRLPIVEYVEEQRFEHRYITKDEISEQIACELYPHLYRVENRLRGYLTRFMTTRFGGTWWKLTASKEMDDKAKMRKKNERVFGTRIDNSAFLIDFDELGKLVFEQTSGLLTRKDIENRVIQLPAEDATALKTLKADLRSNYYNFFKEAFADKDFKTRWNTWESLRNKIAHSNLFTNNDLVDGKQIANELIQIIKEAEESDEQPTVSQAEREAAQEQMIARTETEESVSVGDTNGGSTEVDSESLTEDVFLEELKQQEDFYSNRPNGFVGLVRFFRFHLTDMGYQESEARSMLRQLQHDDKLEVYHVENPYDDTSQTAAIRLAK